jgi:response regulator RpfG family c-di-GMP phosphodiesterase
MSDKSKLPVLVVVDDEEPILRAMRSLLRRDGYQMHFFTSGREALKFLEKNNADIIISDMRMPEMTGSEVLEKSIKLCPNSIRIILSGFEEKSIILEALSAGLAKHYVMKPWEDDQLRQLIKGSIELQRRLRHEHIQELLLSIKNLPSPPNWYSKLMHLLKHDDYSQKLIAYEIEKSPELVAKLLRVSNSVFYGMRRMISTVYEALTFIGTEATLNIVLAIESFDIVSANAGPKVARKIDEMRKEAVIRAHIAREIALNWSSENNPHEAYVAGLLLEIGLVLRFYSSENSFMKFIEFQEK